MTVEDITQRKIQRQIEKMIISGADIVDVEAIVRDREQRISVLKMN